MLKNNNYDDQLTQQTFWEEYWSSYKLPNEVDMNFSFDRCVAVALHDYFQKHQVVGEVFEVGCAPGKWLAFMAKNFNLLANGIEYSKVGMAATLKNFELININIGNIQTGDFLVTEPNRQYDVVMSLGFIEHFLNVDSIVELHLKWLKPGGTLILGVPNFQGIYKIIQKILNNEILEKHNLDIMNLNYFHQLSLKFNLSPKFIKYIGGFEPVLFIGKEHGPVTNLQFVINISLQIAKKIRKLSIFDKVNSSFFSSYILSIYQKNN